MTKGELAECLGLKSARMLVAYEHGEKGPSDLIVGRMAEILNFPRAFFYRPTPDTPGADGVSFRALKRLSAQRRDKALASAALALDLSDWIDERFRLPEPDIPKLASITPEMASESVRSSWQLGQRPIRNMVHLVESHGVRVFSLTEESRDLDAFSFWRDGRPFIFLNTTKSAEHSRMDAAHELGHLILHARGSIRGHGRMAEHEAERFASALLMPRGDVLAQAPRHPRLADLLLAKRRWNVSVAALTYRMHVLGLLSDWQYRSLFIELSKMGFRSREPNGTLGERSQVLDKVFAVLKAEGLSKADIASELALPVDELSRSVFGLVLTSVQGDATAPIPDSSYAPPPLRVI